MTIVVDASVIVAALVDTGPAGRWAEVVVGGSPLAAPHLLPAEVANIVRRASRSGHLTPEVAALAHADPYVLRIDLFAYEPFAERIWALRENLTPHDAWYVALAEFLDAPLATLDLRLTRSTGPRCRFIVP